MTIKPFDRNAELGAAAAQADPDHPATAAALLLLRAAAGLTPEAARGRDAGVALTEVRTVLSRARSARARIDQPAEYERDAAGKLVWTADRSGFVRFEDPDAAEMRTALDGVIALLGRWERTGRATRSTH
ncbi:hypothetical protein ACGRHY_29130 [Streptomyces sp. HK10]|uniref:hypothetical protein n=1 Tax=Streptomyces sp. HK10 TaxID=3373255 RepID=UPI0037485D84